MEYGVRDFKGVGFVIEEPEVSVDRYDNQWCKLIISFDESESPEQCFEVVAKNEAVAFAKTLKVNDSLIVTGSIFHQKEKLDPKQRIYGCNGITLLANRLIKIDTPKRYWLKAFIYGVVSKDPEMVSFKNTEGEMLNLLVRVNYTWMKNDNKEQAAHFFEVKAFKEMGKKGYGELAQGDYCFLECSLKRRLRKEGNWPDIVANWIDH